VWPWDQAWYGEVSTDLFYLLTHAPHAWLSAMIGLMPSKPPLLCWLGQFFVPLAAVTGNVEASLLGFVVATQFATLVLVWVAAQGLAPDNRWAAIAAVLLAGSAPLFVSRAGAERATAKCGKSSRKKRSGPGKMIEGANESIIHDSRDTPAGKFSLSATENIPQGAAGKMQSRCDVPVTKVWRSYAGAAACFCLPHRMNKAPGRLNTRVARPNATDTAKAVAGGTPNRP